MKTTTNNDSLRINAVEESRKWKEAASRKLFAMSREERMAYLRDKTEKFRAEIKARQESLLHSAA